MSLLTLVRHGQASYLAADYDRLSPLGEHQAAQLGIYWARHGITFDQVYCGPARRHLRTMQIVGDQFRASGLPWPEAIEIKEFDEFDAFTMMRLLRPVLADSDETVRALNAEFEAHRESPEAGRKLQKLFEEVSRHWITGRHDLDAVESWAQFRARIGTAFDRVSSAVPSSARAVVFTSGGSIAAAAGHVLALPDDKTLEFVWMSRNCSYSQFLVSGERVSMHAFNAIPHLQDLSMLTYR